jgi:hypothetical protein
MDHQDAVLKEQIERNKKDENDTNANTSSNNGGIDLDQAAARIRDCIVLCATSAKGTLPTNPDFPADIFTVR